MFGYAFPYAVDEQADAKAREQDDEVVDKGKQGGAICIGTHGGGELALCVELLHEPGQEVPGDDGQCQGYPAADTPPFAGEEEQGAQPI